MKTETTDKKALGRKGEELAKEYLLSLGYRFLQENFHTKAGEIDLIFLDGTCLVLVEVKTRRHGGFLPLEKTITPEKIKRILKTAEIYSNSDPIPFQEMRVDAIFIEELEGKFEIKHHCNFW